MLQNVEHSALPTLLAVLGHIEQDVPRMVAELLERPSAPMDEDEGAAGTYRPRLLHIIQLKVCEYFRCLTA